MEYLKLLTLARLQQSLIERGQVVSLFQRANDLQKSGYNQEREDYLSNYICPTAQLVDCPKAANTCKIGYPNEMEVPYPVPVKKEKKMNFNFDSESPQANTLEYLSNRTYGVFSEKRDALQKKYGLVDDDAPQTPKEIIDRLASGKFVVNEDQMDKRAYGSLNQFQWRDPAQKKDKDGFKVAETALNAARTKAEDVMVVMTDPATQLKALQDFESTTIN